MADPLSQLRQFHKNRKQIQEMNDYIVFGDHGWPKKVNTNYLVYSSDGDKSKKEYYTLECLLYFLKNIDLAHHHYVKQAGAYNIPVVHRPDRTRLLEYLKGDLPASSSIDKNAPIPNSLRLPLSEIQKLGNSSGDSRAGLSQQQAQSSNSSDPNRSSDNLSSSQAQKRPHDPEAERRFREELTKKLYKPTSKDSATLIPPQNVEAIAGETAEASAAISKFGPEKLAAMRAKHLAVKRTTIVDADAEIGKSGSGVTDPTNKDTDMMIQMDSDQSRLIKSKEKIWRTRTSILQAQSKNFLKPIMPLLNLLSKTEEGGDRRSHGNTLPGSLHHDIQMNHPLGQHQQQANAHHSQQQNNQKNAYNRYEQERLVKLDIGVEIDTKKSFVSGAANGLSSYNRTQPVAERPSQASQVHSQSRSDQRVSSGGGDRSTTSNSQQQVAKSRSKRTSTVPIIIIPAAPTSLINMYNAKPILQDLTFVDGTPNKPKESEILIQRKKNDDSTALYKIIDNPTRLEAEDWNRVVAVFVQGPAWQFKGWPWGGSPVEIFSRIRGFHLKWDETKLDDNVAKWNVHILELSRNKRHLDKANLLKFWSSLDAYMTKYKSFLKF